MELEPEDEFEVELRQAFERRPAPPGLKRRLLAARAARGGRSSTIWPRRLWQRLAASIALLAALGGGLAWRRHENELRKGDEARREVFAALRIASHALDHVQAQLLARNRQPQSSLYGGSTR